MNHHHALKTAPELARVIRAADPSYRKREACLLGRETVTIHDSYWDGGSRYTYHAIDLRTLRALPAPQYSPPQYGGPTPTVTIPEGVAIVKTGIFMGKTATATVYIHPSNATRLIGG